jgi:DNA-binding response OmpR family regulator
MRQRLAALERRSFLELRYSDEPTPGSETDAYVVAVKDLHRLVESSLFSPAPSPSLPIVLAFGPREYLRAAFLAGCDDYLKEPWDPDELEARLDRLMRARAELRASVGGGYEIEGRMARLADGREVRLSAHEAVVAGLLITNRGVVVSRRALSYALWGRLPQHPTRALDMHVSALRKKLGRDSISCVRGQGYVVD